jgi:hypothetical protein
MTQAESGHDTELDPHRRIAQQGIRASERTEGGREQWGKLSDLRLPALKDPQTITTGPQRYTRKQPETAIGRTKTGNTRPATTSSHRRTARSLSNCDKWQKGTRRAIPPDLQAGR